MSQKPFKILLLLSLQLFAFCVIAQSPQLINYQGAARLANGIPLDNRTISIKFDFRQGSGTGAIVATETQTLQTNLLGLFVTQIGSTANLNAVNWQANSIFLQVSIDTSAGTNFTSLGAQQLVSTPYALHANSVPSSYTNNILTIGSNTYALSPTVAVVPNTSITVSGLGTVTSAGTNTFDINIPAPTFTGQDATSVTGAYPNYTISSATPSIALTTNTSAPPSVTNTGSSFSINVPPPTFSNTGQPIITGSYPNFIVNTPTVGATPITSISPSGLVTVSNPVTNSFVVGVQTPTFTNTGQTLITGTYPNYSVSTPTVPAAITPSIALTTTAAPGASVTSSGSSFSLNVPPPVFTNAGQNIVTGTYPNFTVNTPTVAATPSVFAAGIATVSAAPNYTVGVPSPVFTNVGQNIITGTYPNYSVNTPTVAATPSVFAAGIATVSAAPNYTVGVPSPVFTNVGQNLITGTYPNYSVNTPTIANTDIALTTSAAAGPSISTVGTNSFNINIPPSDSWSLLGNAGTTFTTNYIGTSDNIPLQFRVNGQKSGAIDHLLSNAFLGYQSGQANSAGTFNTAVGHTALTANTTGNSNAAFGYRALVANITGNANAAFGPDALLNNTGGTFNTAAGLNSARGNLTGNSNSAFGRDALYSNTAGSNNVAIGHQAGYSALGSSNVFIGNTAGYFETGSNKLYISNSTTSVSPLIYGDFTTGQVGINTNTGQAIFAVDGKSLTTLGGIHLLNVRDQIGGALPFVINAVTNGQTFGTNTYGRLFRLNNLTTLQFYDMGIGSTNNFYIAGANSYSPAAFNISSTENVGIGTSTPNQKLNVNGNISLDDGAASTAPSRTIGFATGSTGNHGSLTIQAKSQVASGTAFVGGNLILAAGDFNIAAVNPSGSFGGNVTIRAGRNLWPTAVGGLIVFEAGTTANTERMRIDGATGNVGIGTAAPNAPLQFANTTVNRKIVLWEAANNDHQFYGFGINASLLRYQTDATTADHAFFAATGVGASNELMRIRGNGNVGIGTNAPAYKLEVSPGATGIGNANGHVTLFHGSNTGGALRAESNNNGTSGGTVFYAQAYLAGYHGNSPTGNNIGVWGNATGTGADGYGVVATHGAIGLEDKYVGLAGPSYAGIFMGGNVGIGTTNPGQALHVVGDAFKTSGTSAWLIPSDARLKTNVHAYTDGLTELMKINTVWFTYNGEAGIAPETHVGVIAQDLQKIAPYMVKDWVYTFPENKQSTQPGNQNAGITQQKSETKNYLALDNGAMTYMLINAVKEQQKQIEDLKKQVDDQKKLVDQLLKK